MLADNSWLTASEAIRLNDMRIAKRRADWRLGRWTAKRALSAYLNVSRHPQALTYIEIRPAPSGAPEVFLANKPAAVTISLSHRAGVAVCAISRPGVALGCDLEMIEPRSDAFVSDYFTVEEQALVSGACAADRSWLLALLWSGKESALKALRAGLRLDTRTAIVSACDALRRRGEDGHWFIESPALDFLPSHDHTGWCPLHVRYTDSQIFNGWWRHAGNFMRTLVADPPPVPPILFTIPADSGHTAS